MQMGENERDFSSTIVDDDSDFTDEPSVKKLKDDQTDANSAADAGASSGMKGLLFFQFIRFHILEGWFSRNSVP